jgi:response regulator RpfG family c-di-GMP phosphodiesterase
MSENRRIGKYEILAPLGKGSAASVFAGADGDKQVALKIANPNTVPPATIARLRQAAPALARVRHPAIATFIELIETDKAICIVSERAEGEPLAVRLKAGQRPDLRQTWDIARQILEAVEAAHARGVFHGDLKPANVIVDAQGRVKLTDLGVYGMGTNAATAYAAPEYLGGEAPDARADVYQVGAIVYHLVAGAPPFAGERDEMAHRILQERPTDPSSLVEKLAWQLDWVIQRALSKEPMDRFGSAREFMDGLRLGLQDSIGAPLAVPAPAPAQHAKPAAPPPAPQAKPAAPAPQAKPVAPAPQAKPAAAAPQAKPAAPAPQAKPAAAAPQAKPAAAAPQAEPTAPKTVAAAPKEAPAAAKEPAAAPKANLAENAKLITPMPANDDAAEGNEGRARVLFVDDDERVLNALRALFRNDYHVFTADNGAAALELIKRNDIPIVVSDQRMPGMSGVELLREVRKASPNSVRMLLTGYTELAALVGSINEGEVFRFIRKPWDNDEIRATVAEAAIVAATLAARAPAAGVSPRTAGSLLVIDPGQSLAKGLERLVAGEAKVTLVATVPEAAKLLQSNEYAAIVADQRAGKDDLIKLFRVVKAKRPATLSILVAEDPDSELVAELINQAQIYRFLSKPIDPKELRSHVSAALRHFAEFKRSSAKESGLAENVGALPGGLVSRSA